MRDELIQTPFAPKKTNKKDEDVLPQTLRTFLLLLLLFFFFRLSASRCFDRYALYRACYVSLPQGKCGAPSQEQLNKNYAKFKDACPGITNPNQGVKLALVDVSGLKSLSQMQLPSDTVRSEPTSAIMHKVINHYIYSVWFPRDANPLVSKIRVRKRKR